MHAADVMTRQVVTVSENASVAAAVRLMRASGHGGLPVIGEGGRVVGILDRITLLRLVLPKYADEIGDLAFVPEDFKAFEMRIAEIGRKSVREVMRPCDICVAEDTSLVEVAALMVLKHAEDVPVLRGQELVGIVGLQDVVDKIASPAFKRGEEQ
jgi:CBS domain-containing protein